MTTEFTINQKVEMIARNSEFTEILNSLERHEEYRKECLNMIASENSMSPAAKLMMGSDLGNRYSVGPEERWFPGLDDYTQIENIAIKLTKELVPGADHVCVQPISGMQANQVVYNATINRGDLVLVVKEKHGGHFSHRKGEFINRDTDEKKWLGSHAKTLLDEYGAVVDYIPFHEKQYNIDTQKACDLIIARKPKVILVGTSEMLFPAPLRELRVAADKTGVNTKIIYDAAHVFGLILGGEFQKPLVEGADILTTSTNKTMGGPDHGLVAWTEDAQQKFDFRKGVNSALVPLYTSNHHANEVGGVAMTLAEFKTFGKDYAKQVIANSRALASALNMLGVKIIGPRDAGYTMSHEVLIDVGQDSEQAKLALAKANIITSKCPVPYACGVDDTGEPNTGIRIGTNEMTRMNMNEPEMVKIAGFYADVLLGKKTPERVREEVRSFRLQPKYQVQRYCFPLQK